MNGDQNEPTNKRFGWIALLITFLVGIVVGYWLLPNPPPESTGATTGQNNCPTCPECPGCPPPPACPTCTCPEFTCGIVETSAAVEIVGDNSSGGSGSVFGTNAKISIDVKNMDQNQGVKSYVEIACSTLNDPKTILNSSEEYIKPGEIYPFKLEYEIDMGEDWNCSDYKIYASKINGCELRKI